MEVEEAIAYLIALAGGKALKRKWTSVTPGLK
jgi:hypothetical protein